MQARSLLLTAPKHLQWVTETLPALQPDEILVQTTTGAISIGAKKELTIIASSDGFDYPQHARWFFNHVLPEQGHLLEKLFKHEITAHQLIDTFEQLARGTISPIKVLIHYEQ